MNTIRSTQSAARGRVLVASLVLLALAACSDEKSIEGAGTTSSSTVAASTTSDLTSTTLAPALTTVPESSTTAAPTTAAPPAPTAAPAPAPTADFTALGASRLVMLPEDDNVFTVAEFGCSEGMSFDYGEVEQCVEQDNLLVLSYRIPEAKRVVEVYQLVENTWWVEAYRTTEEYDFELSSVDLHIGDYAGIGYPAAFIGYRIDGSGQYLDFDIVQLEAGGLDVRGIRAIDHGNVGLPGEEPGVVISAVYAATDPNCCPSNLLYQDLDYVDGAWSVNTGTLYPPASAPSRALAF